jgi:predicted dehydrogenase
VVALDYNPKRLELATALGAEWALDLSRNGIEEAIRETTAGRGVDAVVIAAATGSSEPFEHAASIARDRARVVMVGMTGTAFPYAEFMKKELKIVMSRSYGPGRYDDDFETRGVKYPVGWVRWTETDNLVEILRLMQPNQELRLDVSSLITHRFPLLEAKEAYSLVTSGSEHLGVLLTYTGDKEILTTPTITSSRGSIGDCVIGVIGGGNYARTVLLPKLKQMSGISLGTLVTERGFSAGSGQEHFGFLKAATDVAAVMENDGINAVVIATRHDSHAELASQALKAGKAVWVEKPLALDLHELNAVIEARNAVPEESGAFLQIGFNRRFAPATVQLKAALARQEGPKVLIIRINAGAIAADHWVHASDTGGGRLVGEGCHFIDLARALVGFTISRVDAKAAVNTDGACDDAAISLSFSDGSLASIIYTARGDARSGKERIEAYAGGASYLIDDFRVFTASGDVKAAKWKGNQDKGVDGSLTAFVNAIVNGGPAPVDEVELIETSSATLAVMESLRSGQAVELN